MLRIIDICWLHSKDHGRISMIFPIGRAVTHRTVPARHVPECLGCYPQSLSVSLPTQPHGGSGVEEVAESCIVGGKEVVCHY